MMTRSLLRAITSVIVRPTTTNIGLRTPQIRRKHTKMSPCREDEDEEAGEAVKREAQVTTRICGPEICQAPSRD